MGCTPTKLSRKDGLFFDDKDAISVDKLEDEDGPPQVRHFTFTNITCKSFEVAWEAPADVKIDRYQVRIFPPEGVRSKSLINSLGTTSHTFERLKTGTRYTVGVVAIDANGKRSTCASASESTLPQAPTSLFFPPRDISASTFRATWKSSPGARDCYEISITPTHGVTGDTFVSDLHHMQYVFTGLVPGIKYYVTVVSVANGRKSDALEGAVITNPGHVYDLSFPHVTHNEMQIVWKPPLGEIECYTLTLSSDHPDEDPIEISKIKQTSYRFNGLVTGRDYTCEIYSHAHGKISLRKTFQQCTLPSEVGNLSVTNISTHSAMVTWDSAPGDSDDYDLFLNPKELAGESPSPRGVTGNMYTFKGLSPGTKYTVGIVTNSKDKISQRVVSAFLTEPSHCGEITFPKDELKSTQIGVHWISAEGHWDTYTILVMKDGGAGGTWSQGDITRNRYTFTDLTPGAEYLFSITTNSEGRQSISKSARCSTLPCPAGVISYPPDGVTSASIKFNWSPSGGGVDHYKIRVTGEGFNHEDTVKYDKTDYLIEDLSPGTTYEIFVSVISYGVESEPSTGSCTTGPARVSDLETQNLSKNKIRVSWSPPEGGVDSYDVTISPDQGVDCELRPARIEETNYTFDRLIPGTLYAIHVTPIARGIAGPISEVLGYTTPGDILNVHMPADEITKDSVKVIWRVEGNSKHVLASLVQEGAWEEPTLISAIVTRDTERVFEGLQDNTRYVIKLQAIGAKDLAPAGGENSKGLETTVVHKTSTPGAENSTPNPVDPSFALGDAPAEAAVSSTASLEVEDQPSAEADTGHKSNGNEPRLDKTDSNENVDPHELEIIAASENLNIQPVVSDESVNHPNLPST